MKLDYKKTFLLGFGFFGVSLIWSLYNSFVPIILSGFIASNALIGFIMTFDNILAVTVQPIVGASSDRTRTKIGRRMPYLLIGAPIAAIFFSLIPAAKVFWLLIVIIVFMNLFMALFRPPVIALMPDITPSPLRSKANGIINFMGGFGALIAFFVGGKLFDVNRQIPFIGAAVLLVFAILMVYLSIKEPKKIPQHSEEDISAKLTKVSAIAIAVGVAAFVIMNLTGAINGFLSIFNSLEIYHSQMLVSLVIFALIVFIVILRMVEKNSIFIFLSIFFWFFGYNAVETFFTLYGTNTLHITAGKAAMILGMFSLSFLIFAIPSGFIATRIGRKKMIIIGLSALVLLLGAMGFTTNIYLIIALMVFGGLAWAAVNINSYPMICDITTDEMLGTYTGLYYFFSMLAQTISPPVVGVFIDATKTYKTMFTIVPIFFLLALITMLFVKKGEAKKITTSEIMEQMEV